MCSIQTTERTRLPLIHEGIWLSNVIGVSMTSFVLVVKNCSNPVSAFTISEYIWKANSVAKQLENINFAIIACANLWN